jgi:hypothetical protein
MEKWKSTLLRIADFLAVLFVYPSAWLLKMVRRAGVHNLRHCKNALLKVGVFPIRDHYYEPQFDNRSPKKPLSEDRNLPGIDWNVSGQLKILSGLSFSQELADIPHGKPSTRDFYMDNGAFESGDAEYWYQLIRYIKPKKIFEVGSGHSTLMAIRALRRNQESNPGYYCKHVCIEPYEMPWLEKTRVTAVVRKKIEDIDPSFFSELGENDVLFIDSSHIIRPSGDVLFEYLQLLPTLNKGVIVHVHDIFSPRNYPKQWIEVEIKFWNEQYLLEAFLSDNRSWRIVGALNYLQHHHYDVLKSVAPHLTPAREPGSFYIQRIG